MCAVLFLLHTEFWVDSSFLSVLKKCCFTSCWLLWVLSRSLWSQSPYFPVSRSALGCSCPQGALLVCGFRWFCCDVCRCGCLGLSCLGAWSLLKLWVCVLGQMNACFEPALFFVFKDPSDHLVLGVVSQTQACSTPDFLSLLCPSDHLSSISLSSSH